MNQCRRKNSYLIHTSPYCCLQVLEELFTYWNLEDADDELEELEDALIVSYSS